MKQVLILILIFFLFLGCSSEKSEVVDFQFPFIVPQKVYGGMDLTLLVKFTSAVDKVSGESLPVNSSFTLVNKLTAILNYSPAITETGVKRFVLYAESGNKKIKGEVQVTVLTPYIMIDLPPIISAPKQITVKEGEKIDFYISINDAEQKGLTVNSDFSQLSGKDYSFSDNHFVWNTDYNSSGTYIINFSVSDGVNKVETRVLIYVFDSESSPELYSESFTFTVHEGDKYEFAFGVTGVESGVDISLLCKAKGMSLNYDEKNKIVHFVFIPGTAYKTGDKVNSYILIKNSQINRVIKFTFDIISEGALIIDVKSENFLLSPLLYQRYLLFMSASTETTGFVKLLDMRSSEYCVINYSLKNCSKIVSAGIYNDNMLLYSCFGTDETNYMISGAQIFDGAGEPIFSPTGAVKNIIIPNYSSYLTDFETNWLGIRDNYLFMPDYSRLEEVKIYGKSNGASKSTLFETIEDINWVSAPATENAPKFNIVKYGFSFFKDGADRFLVSTSEITDWPEIYNNISKRLAMVKVNANNNFVNARVDFVMPVTLPVTLSDSDTIFRPVFWGDLSDGRSRFFFVDGSGFRGTTGYLSDNGVDFSSNIIIFPYKVSKIFIEDYYCFFALSINGDKVRRYCNIDGEIKDSGREINVSNFVSVSGKLTDMRFSEGRVIMVYNTVDEGTSKIKLIMVSRELLR